MPQGRMKKSRRGGKNGEAKKLFVLLSCFCLLALFCFGSVFLTFFGEGTAGLRGGYRENERQAELGCMIRNSQRINEETTVKKA